MAELKPCPFCGGKVYPVYSSKTERFYMYHYKTKKKCIVDSFMLQGEFKTLEEAWNAWNAWRNKADA